MDPLAYVNQGREGSGIAQVFNVTESRQQGERAIRQSEKDLDEYRKQQRQAEQEMKELISIDLDGWDIDVQKEIFEDLTGFNKLVKSQWEQGINVRGITDWDAYTKVVQARQGVERKKAASKAQKVAYDKTLAALATGKFVYDEETKEQLEKYRKSLIDERSNMDPNAFLVPKLNTRDEAKKLAESIPTKEDLTLASSGFKGLAIATSTTTRDKETLSGRSSSVWESDSVLQRNISKQAWIDMVGEFAEDKVTEKPVRFATDPAKGGKGEETPAPSKPITVTEADLSAFRAMKKTDGNPVTFGDGTTKRSVNVSTINGGKPIPFLDPLTNEELMVNATQILEDGDAYYLVANVPSMKEESTAVVGTTTTASGKTTTQVPTRGAGGATSKKAGERADQSSIKDQSKKKSASQTYIFPINDLNDKMLIERLKLSGNFGSVKELFGKNIFVNILAEEE
jgi:hypothetical protein